VEQGLDQVGSHLGGIFRCFEHQKAILSSFHLGLRLPGWHKEKSIFVNPTTQLIACTQFQLAPDLQRDHELSLERVVVIDEILRSYLANSRLVYDYSETIPGSGQVQLKVMGKVSQLQRSFGYQPGVAAVKRRLPREIRCRHSPTPTGLCRGREWPKVMAGKGTTPSALENIRDQNPGLAASCCQPRAEFRKPVGLKSKHRLQKPGFFHCFQLHPVARSGQVVRLMGWRNSNSESLNFM